TFKFRRFIIKDINKFITDDFTFLFWVRYTFKFRHKTVFSIDFNNIHIKTFTKLLHYHLRFTFTKRSEEHTSELQSRFDLVCRLLLEKKKHKNLLRLGSSATTRSRVHLSS